MASPRSSSLLAVWVALGAAMLAGLGQQAVWIAQDRDRLVTTTIYEDAFYYFQTSRNLARGHGAVSSGGIAHNGFHPLWMVLCAISFWAGDGLRGPGGAGDGSLGAIRVILGFGAILGALTTLAIYGILRGLGCGRFASAFAAVCFQMNPYMLGLSTSGLEAPLNALLLATTLLWILRPGRGRMGRAHCLALGILFGLVFLVRTDNAFFLAATWIALAWRARWDRRARLWLLFSAGVALLVTLPWWIWNLHRFGSPMQGSASALPVVREIAFFERNPGASAGDLFWRRCGLFLGWHGWFPAALMYSGLGSVWYLMFAALAAALFTRDGRRESPRLGLALLDLVPLLVAVVCLGFAHRFIRLATREWYYVTSDVCLALVWGAFVHFLLTVLPGKRARTAAIALMVCLAGGMLARKTTANWRDRLSRPRAYALEVLDAMESVEDTTPDESFGATDSGALGFFASRPVINLDGVVNPEAARAVREGRLLDYVEKKGIRRVVITPRMANERILGKGFRERLGPFPSLTAQGYEVKPRGPSGAVPAP